MRLIDEILAAVGSPTDHTLCGAITSMAGALQQAQCFELTSEVVLACGHVATSKPSSLLSAMPLTKLPYAKTWIEWQPPSTVPHLADTANPDRPLPTRMGCLFEAASPSDLAHGFMTWAWLHTTAGGGLVILPYAVQFDWRNDGNVLETVSQTADMIDAMPAEAHAYFQKIGLKADTAWMRDHANRQRITPERAAEGLRHAKPQWNRLAENSEEQIALVRLMEHAIVCPNFHCLNLLIELGKKAEPKALERLLKSWAADLEGEPDFALAFIIMLNARSALERTAEDLTRLNRRRISAKKIPLREFVVTRLALPPSRSRQAAAGYISRAGARQHLVRGHFKVRSSGIFWWSPFVRGHGDQVTRSHYAVRA